MSAKTISVSNLRSGLGDALDAVTADDILIITRRGKKERAIIDLDVLEDLLAASNPAFLKKIRTARASTDYLSHEDVFGAI